MRRFTATTSALAIAAAGLIAATAGTAQAPTCSTDRLPWPDSSCTPGATSSLPQRTSEPHEPCRPRSLIPGPAPGRAS